MSSICSWPENRQDKLQGQGLDGSLSPHLRRKGEDLSAVSGFDDLCMIHKAILSSSCFVPSVTARKEY